MRADVVLYGVGADDVEWLNRDEKGAVDLKVKSKGREVRMFLAPDLVRMIAAVAKAEEAVA